MEHRCKFQQQQIFELKQELTNNTAELKLRLAKAEGNTHTQNTYTVLITEKCTCTLADIFGMSHSDRPSRNRESTVQASFGGNGQSAAERGNFKMKRI